MSRDRIAEWGKDRPENPLDAIELAIRQYMGAAGVVKRRSWHVRDWLTASIRGKPTNPFDTPEDRDLRRRAIEADAVPADRWFKVWSDSTYINVLTRQQDELVNAVADGFFLACVRRWRMKVDAVTARETGVKL